MTTKQTKEVTTLEVTVDWDPAYELLVSFLVFVWRGKHVLVELGQTWVDDVKQRLPSDFAQQVSHARGGFKSQHEDDLLGLLVRTCPIERDAVTWVDWLAQLSPGDAYELLVPVLPESGPKLPRDFVGWRDRTAALLRTWNSVYFSGLDPQILDGLRADADRVRALIGSMPPRDLIEQVTNGVSIEPSPGAWRVELTPQHHLRPYNNDCLIADGMVVLYPADVLPTPADAPPTALLRLTRGLGDESRLRILRYLSVGTRSLTEVARFAGLSQPTVHHHLTQLRAAGLVRLHYSLVGPVRYSLRTHALEQLSRGLGSYLEPSGGPL